MPNKIRNGKIPAEVVEHMQELYAAKWTIADIAEEVGVSWSTAYGYTKARQEGYVSLQQKHQMQLSLRGFASRTAYTKWLAEENGCSSIYELRSRSLEDHGYGSLSAYQRDKAEQRSHRKSYRKVSEIIVQRLDEMGKTQRWLAQELGVNKSTMIQYAHGKLIPRGERRKKLCEVLQVDESILEKIINNS